MVRPSPALIHWTTDGSGIRADRPTMVITRVRAPAIATRPDGRARAQEPAAADGEAVKTVEDERHPLPVATPAMSRTTPITTAIQFRQRSAIHVAGGRRKRCLRGQHKARRAHPCEGAGAKPPRMPRRGDLRGRPGAVGGCGRGRQPHESNPIPKRNEKIGKNRFCRSPQRTNRSRARPRSSSSIAAG